MSDAPLSAFHMEHFMGLIASDIPHILCMDPALFLHDKYEQQRVFTREDQKRMGGKKSIFKFEKIFLPLNESFHWWLCVVDIFEEEILVYDSAQSPSHPDMIMKVRHWLQNQWGDEICRDPGRKIRDPTSWKVALRTPASQNNGTDGGVFATPFMYAIASETSNGRMTFATPEHMKTWRELILMARLERHEPDHKNG